MKFPKNMKNDVDFYFGIQKWRNTLRTYLSDIQGSCSDVLDLKFLEGYKALAKELEEWLK